MRPPPCAWCAKNEATHEHQRPNRLAPLGWVWVPACSRCHRWLTGATGTLGLLREWRHRELELEGAA